MRSLARSPKQIGTAIRRARLKKGWSQSKLAQTAGVRQATISRIESGHATAQIETVLNLLSVLELELQITERSHFKPLLQRLNETD